MMIWENHRVEVTSCLLTPCPLTNTVILDSLPTLCPRPTLSKLFSTFKMHLHDWLFLPDDPDIKCPWQSTRAMALLMILYSLLVIGWVAIWGNCCSSFFLNKALFYDVLPDSITVWTTTSNICLIKQNKIILIPSKLKKLQK